MTIGNKQITKQFVLKLAGFVAIGLVVLGVVVYFGLIWREKRQFAQAEKEIDALYTQIVEKVGKPDQEKKEKTCGYASRAYGKGPRYCNVRSYVLYSKSNLATSNNKMRELSQIVGSVTKDERVLEPKDMFYQYESVGSDQNFIQTLKSQTKLNCSVRYTYPLVESSTSALKPTETENLLVSIHCGGPARAEYFPVKD